MLFGLYGNMVADEDAGLLAGDGNDARCCQNARLTVSNEGAERGVKAKGITTPKFEIAVVIAVAIAVTVACSILVPLGDGVPGPFNANILAAFAADGDDFGC